MSWDSTAYFPYVYFLYEHMEIKRVIKIYPNKRLAKYVGDTTDF